MTVAVSPLQALRAELAKRGLDGFLVPHADEWQNEYQPAASARLGWLTGFTGSAGMAVVTADRAALFADGRYTLQAATQAPAFEQLHLTEQPYAAWVGDVLQSGQALGFDPRLTTESSRATLQQSLADRGIRLVAVEDNPVDAVWTDRPALPTAAVAPHPLEYAGVSAEDKRVQLAGDLDAARADAIVVTSPDVIAWLFNLRGNDVPCTPLALSTAIVREDGTAELFIDPAKLGDEARRSLGNAVTVRAESEFAAGLAGLAGKAVLADPASVSAWVVDRLAAAGATLRRGTDPNLLRRARKNDTEIAGTRTAHRRDGVAIVRFLIWLSANAESGSVDELAAVEKLREIRAAGQLYRDQSFDTIAGAGPNGAIVHYRSDQTSNRKLERHSLFLLDSGGQYSDGTTDITRTVAIGTPSPEMRDRFTRVLKGHIALACARFPAGTSGSQLDVLARSALWSAGLDYDHGTGHGVGSYLSVHEGPARIAKQNNAVALEPGMILSNEPGYYKTGAFGIRIENLVLVRPAEPVEGGDRPMLWFETLTLAPIDQSLVDLPMLTHAERNWVNKYHARVYAELCDLLTPAECEWLQRATTPL